MSPSHQLQSTENPSSTTMAIQKRGTKRSCDMQYEDTLEVSDDDASMDSDSNWKHIRNPSKGSGTVRTYVELVRTYVIVNWLIL